MARLIVPDTENTMVPSGYGWWQIALVGAGIGVLQWVIAALLGGFVIDQLLCRSSITVASCAQSSIVAGDVATIIVGVIGLVVLVRMRVLRPLVVVVASAILLWGLPVMTSGLAWGEVVFWSALTYGLAYSVFAWLSRYARTIPVLLSVTAVIALMYIIIRL
jgi:hypothetical protein